MNGRERVQAIIAAQESDRCAFWLGNPHPDSWPRLFQYFRTTDQEEIRRRLNDDFRWIPPETYRHPQGKPIFDTRRKGVELSAGGYFSDCEDVAMVETFEWPEPQYLDFTDTLSQLRQKQDYYRASGFWAPFFHDVADFFGMENYFLKMLTHPEVVHAVTRHVVDFYLEANRRFFEAAGNLFEGYFFGNDFGTQRDLLINPELLEEFVFPYMQELINLAKAYGYQVILHSCGSIYRIIPRLLEMGIDALHPLQARAAGMDAQTLAENFKGKLAFMGGIDTQHLLIHGSPPEIRAEVRRVIRLLGPRLIVSPSHEAILPNIPPQNIEAMAQAVRETVSE